MNIVLILSLLAAGCTTILARKWPEKDGVPCTCSRLHDPVCGSDGQDYPNRGCARNCGKVRGFTRGYCDQPALCGCPYNIATVCARRPDGTLDDFVNRCHAECQNGAEFVSDGPCPAKPVQPLPALFVEQLRQLRSTGKERVKKAQGCICAAIYSPVCGLKNRIWRDYSSQCVANCAGVKTTKPGTCRPKRSCPCGRIYRPVCARKPDGTLKDYNNDCLAECEDAVKVSSGRCAAKPDNSLPQHVKKNHPEEELPCVCTLEYKPVCTESHGVRKVYTNKCVAECDNATDLQDGLCEGPALLPVFRNDKDDSVAAQLPWIHDDSNDTNDSVTTQLPWIPDDSDDLDAAQLPWISDDSDDLDAAQLPWIPDDSDDLDAAQLPWIPDDSDVVANQLPVFPSLFKRRVQH